MQNSSVKKHWFPLSSTSSTFSSTTNSLSSTPISPAPLLPLITPPSCYSLLPSLPPTPNLLFLLLLNPLSFTPPYTSSCSKCPTPWNSFKVVSIQVQLNQERTVPIRVLLPHTFPLLTPSYFPLLILSPFYLPTLNSLLPSHS